METVRLDRDIFQTTAPTGVIVLSERVASVRSAAVGMWVRSASAHEARPKMGVSHLLEHMVFKGTERRSAQEIALALESRGGSLDAYTSRDTTAFQARVLDTDLPRALDVLTDLVRNPVLRSNDLELERNVVLEEINTAETNPARPRIPPRPTSYSPRTPFATPIPANMRCWCSATCSGAACRAGCSSGFGRSWASRTRFMRSRASTAIWEWRECMSVRSP